LEGVSGVAAPGGRIQGAAKLVFLMKIVSYRDKINSINNGGSF